MGVSCSLLFLYSSIKCHGFFFLRVTVRCSLFFFVLLLPHTSTLLAGQGALLPVARRLRQLLRKQCHVALFCINMLSFTAASRAHRPHSQSWGVHRRLGSTFHAHSRRYFRSQVSPPTNPPDVFRRHFGSLRVRSDAIEMLTFAVFFNLVRRRKDGKSLSNHDAPDVSF